MQNQSSSNRLTNPSSQWAMVIPIGVVFALLPETPWWLASKGKLDKATKVLQSLNGGIEGYDVQEQIVRFPCGPTASNENLLVFHQNIYADSNHSIPGCHGNYCSNGTPTCRGKQGAW